MATARVDMATGREPGVLESITFARPRQFAWKSLALAVATLALGPIVLWEHALAATIYLAALAIVHVAAIGIFVVKTRKEDIAPSPFGLFWRVVGLAVVVALLMSVRLVPESPWFWPALGGIWLLHTAGLALLHVRAKEGAGCPFLPGAWRHKV